MTGTHSIPVLWKDEREHDVVVSEPSPVTTRRQHDEMIEGGRSISYHTGEGIKDNFATKA